MKKIYIWVLSRIFRKVIICKGVKHCKNRYYEKEKDDCIGCWAEVFIKSALTVD